MIESTLESLLATWEKNEITGACYEYLSHPFMTIGLKSPFEMLRMGGKKLAAAKVCVWWSSPVFSIQIGQAGGKDSREWGRKWQEGGGRSREAAAMLTRTTQSLAALLRSSPSAAYYSMKVSPPTSHTMKSIITINSLAPFPSYIPSLGFTRPS